MSETFTDKLKLSKRDTGDLNWGQGANANLEALDAHIQQSLLRPPRTLLVTLGSGAAGANLSGNTAYFYKVTAVNSVGETTEGKIPAVMEAQVTQPATPLPVILQWETVKGATGYKIYKSAASGQEKFLASVSGESSSTFTDDGNTETIPEISVPTSNSARTSVSRLIAGANVTLSPADGTGEVTVNASGAVAGVSSIRKAGEAVVLTGDVELVQANGMALVQDTPNKRISLANDGILTLRKDGEVLGLKGDAKLKPGSNITLTQDGVGNSIEISAAGGGAWTKVYEEILPGTSSAFSVVTGLDLDTHKLYRFILSIRDKSGVAGDISVQLIMNNLTNLANYKSRRRTYGNDGTITLNAAESGPVITNLDDHAFIEGFIHNQSGNDYTCLIAKVHKGFPWYWFMEDVMLTTYDIVSANLTQLQVKTDNTMKYFGAGSWLRIFRPT